MYGMQMYPRIHGYIARQADRQTAPEREERSKEGRGVSEVGGQTERQTGRKTDRQTIRQAGRQTGRQAGRQAGRVSSTVGE
jgi:hypothetical protein